MRVFFQIVGVAFALFLLRMAYKFLEKDKEAKSLSTASLAAVLLLASMFYGFFETHIIGKLFDANKKLDSFQATVTEMQNELSRHQQQLEGNQKELNAVQGKIRTNQSEVVKSQMDITNQYSELKALQSQLMTAQINLDTQQKKLEDLQYWFSNLFSNMTTEIIPGDDTNRVYPIAKRGRVIFKLSAVPIKNSIQLVSASTSGNAPVVTGFSCQNLIGFTYAGDWKTEWSTHKYVFFYVKDARQTNILHDVSVGTNDIILDNAAYLLPIP